MKRTPKRGPRAIALLALLACLALPCARVLADEEGPPPEPPKAEAPAEGAALEGTPGDAAGKTEEKPKAITLNLKGAPIDQIVKFISDNTGKVVVKSKDVQAQVTILSPEPMPPARAVELIYQALQLEGVAVVERDGVINLVPAAKLAEMGVETLVPAAGPAGAGYVRKIVDVKFADVAEIQELLEPMLAEGSKALAVPSADRIILTARAQELPELEKLIAQLDVLEIRETQVRIFQLKYASADEIAPILETILRDGGDGKGQSPARSSSRSGGRPTPAKAEDKEDVVVIPYTAANWLVVRGSQAKLEAAERLLAQLDKEKPPELALNVILIKHSEASELARRLSEVFRRRPRSRDVRDTIEVTADERSNALIVYSSESNFGLIQEIVARLDTEDARKTETRSYELKFADADDVAEQLNDLYSAIQQRSVYDYYWGYYPSRRGGTAEIKFVPERRTNTLIVIAEPSEFSQIEELMSKLDQPISGAEVAPRIYRIEHIDAKELTDVLNDLFGVEDTSRRGGYPYYYYRGGRDQQTIGRLYGKVRFVHEPATNSVIVVTNNKENFAIIEQLVREMDKSTAEYANTMVYTLENADAGDVADQLNSLFAPPGAGRAGQRGADEDEESRDVFYSWLYGTSGRQREEERPISNLIGKVRVVPDMRTNSLLITTAVQNFDVLRQLVERLDVQSPKVLVKVQLIEITRTREERIGTRFAADSSIFESADFNNGLIAFLGLAWEEITSDTVLNADIDLSTLVQFLQRDFDASVLAQPSIVVNNNEEASIFVGALVPRLTESQREPGTTARNDSFEYENVGTTLRIKPHINRNDRVVTTIYLTASQIREGETRFGGDIFDTRTYETELALDSGQTVVIGGILRQEETTIIHRVPILGHIPILKLLFSKTEDAASTTELIAFITPKVLKTRQDDDAATEAEHIALELIQESEAPEAEEN